MGQALVLRFCLEVWFVCVPCGVPGNLATVTRSYKRRMPAWMVKTDNKNIRGGVGKVPHSGIIQHGIKSGEVIICRGIRAPSKREEL
jgi:hypothetical protein